ncbi:hypothetical protein [Bifidobacterium felsineum]|uniref:Uncharacterized protein n=1 Tax=Bifidobacterium felsineum TaxID=2045440 RepID=A0A2M9HKW3_9BIFI|nr:hypothetical protein [Bifidobacterium felsineum]MBT1164686.1 hypothetical protein [Bifidobacterium felsineum]PJM77455.1 hypothetical protein CSQ86_06175 [Bifidobacterium felsineum]
MSTTIDVYPTTDYLPLVEETRSRTQELYQQLLDRYGIRSTVEVKAFHPRKPDEELRYVDPATRWKVEMDLGFAYLINGEWRASSWPSLWERTRIDQPWIDDYVKSEGKEGYPPSMLGECFPIDADEFEVPLSDEDIKLLNAQPHWWHDIRNFAGPAVASTGYGFVAAALAEETHGRLASFDCAFADDGHNGETAKQFLAWWGDEQMAFYGKEPFQ